MLPSAVASHDLEFLTTFLSIGQCHSDYVF
jgi:hypothetical protein